MASPHSDFQMISAPHGKNFQFDDSDVLQVDEPTIKQFFRKNFEDVLSRSKRVENYMEILFKRLVAFQEEMARERASQLCETQEMMMQLEKEIERIRDSEKHEIEKIIRIMKHQNDRKIDEVEEEIRVLKEDQTSSHVFEHELQKSRETSAILEKKLGMALGTIAFQKSLIDKKDTLAREAQAERVNKLELIQKVNRAKLEALNADLEIARRNQEISKSEAAVLAEENQILIVENAKLKDDLHEARAMTKYWIYKKCSLGKEKQSLEREFLSVQSKMESVRSKYDTAESARSALCAVFDQMWQRSDEMGRTNRERFYDVLKYKDEYCSSDEIWMRQMLKASRDMVETFLSRNT